MKTITQYKSEDGHIFGSQEDCEQYETLVMEVARKLKDTIGKRPDSMDFANGAGYVQHQREQVWDLKKALYDWANYDVENDSFGYLGRLLSDGGNPKENLLYTIWTRLYSIDGQFREWGEPYYALNPGKGKDIALTP